MKYSLSDYRLLQKWSPRMSGVFSQSDIKNLFNEDNPVLLYRRIAALVSNKALTRFKRGFYVTEPCNLEVLAQRLYPESYISLGTVLARHLLIGSVPVKTVYAVKTGRNRTFNTELGNLVYCGIARRLMFGFEYENGVHCATAEKAFLDTLYFYQKGFRFSFNVFEDIDISRVDEEKIKTFLKQYKNPKFITFVKGVLSGRHS